MHLLQKNYEEERHDFNLNKQKCYLNVLPQKHFPFQKYYIIKRDLKSSSAGNSFTLNTVHVYEFIILCNYLIDMEFAYNLSFVATRNYNYIVTVLCNYYTAYMNCIIVYIERYKRIINAHNSNKIFDKLCLLCVYYFILNYWQLYEIEN